MNDQTIQMIAQAIIANTKVIQSLIDALPHDAVARVATTVKTEVPDGPVAAPASVAADPVVPVAPVESPVTAPAAQPAPVAPVAPAAPAAPVMPPPPTFVAPAAAPNTSSRPFSEPKGLIDYVMGVYKALGPAKGAQIQTVLTSLGCPTINDVKPEQYDALFSAVEALKG